MPAFLLVENSLSRRGFLAGSAALLTACASGGGPAAPPAAPGYPRTLTHAFGDVVVPAEPQRIAALGFADADNAAALGVTPVTRGDNGYPGRIPPWFTEAVGGAAVTEVTVYTGIAFEQVAAAAPDLILAGTAQGLDATTYERLSAIAPTVAFETELYGDTWQQQLRLAGRALGREERAEQVVADVEGRFATAVAEHPEFRGATFAYTAASEDGSANRCSAPSRPSPAAPTWPPTRTPASGSARPARCRSPTCSTASSPSSPASSAEGAPVPTALLTRPTIDDSLTRRGFLAGTVLLAGCAAPPPGPPAAGPRTLTTALGEVALPASPQRVVTLGSAETDTAVALGGRPVAVSRAFGSSPFTPWLETALDGAPVPTLDLADGPPLEEIAAARPDVILAPSYTDLDAHHDRLAQIAPVVGYLTAPFVDTWQDQALLVGRALGLEDRARELITAVDADLAARAARHPGWAGRTITYGVHYDTVNTRVFAVQEDKSMLLFTGVFGLSVPRALQEVGAAGNLNGTVDVGPERLDLLEADALLLTYLSEDLRVQLESDPLFAQLDVVRRGGYAAVERAGGGALREPSLLSLPYAADELEARLTATLG